jgi:hypothetical protein
MPLETDLEQLLNRYNQMNVSGTPEFVLAAYLRLCLDAFNSAVIMREKWYGREAADTSHAHDAGVGGPRGKSD